MTTPSTPSSASNYATIHGSPGTGFIRTTDARQLAMDSYNQGAMDAYDTLIDALDLAEVHGRPVTRSLVDAAVRQCRQAVKARP